jgi:signal transduction histidine kinase/ligand-binding sensor domain-containing protein
MAGSSFAVDYSFDIWQTEDGLPYNSVTAVVQTRDGYLWLGTYNGLVRFDGIRFMVFDPGNTPEMNSGRVTSLFEDRDERLWIGHETGELTSYYRGRFTHVALGGAWPGGEVADINTDPEGDVWLLNKNGWLFRLRGNYSIPPEKSTNSLPKVTSLIKGKKGKLWVLRDTMVGSLEKGQLTNLPTSDNPPADNFQRACPSEDGGLWIAGNGRLRKWAAQGWTKDLGPVPWGSGTAMAMVESKTGDVLVGTLESGLYIVSEDGSSRHFSRQNGLPHDWVRCLCEDREGNIWVGTGGGGLAALRARTVAMVKVPDDWQGRAVLSVTPSAAGGLWVGTEGAGLYRLTENSTTHFVLTNGLWNIFDWSVLEDSHSRLWVGSWGNGLFYRDSDVFQQPAGLDPSGAVTALYQGHDGALWLGTSSGLGRYENGNCTWHGRKEGLALPDVRTITEDSSGTIWFGMLGGGLGRLQNGKLTQFRKHDGLASDFVWSLFVDEEDALWIGTFGGGLCRLKQGKFVTLATEQGLPNNVICHIEDDGRGNFWISSYGGIFRVRKNDLRQCADEITKSVFCFIYGKADGLSTLECSGGFQPSGCQTRDGRIWFPTTKGLAVVNPADVKINPLLPPTVVEEASVDGQAVSLLSEADAAKPFRLEIPPGKERFEFRYSGLSLVAPEKVRFQYMLEGLETDWVKAGTRRVAYYSYLKPGNYTFRVKSCNNDGIWDERGAALSLRVLPQFWQTWWFATGMVLAGGGAVGGAARYLTRRRLRKKMEKLERQRAIEKERARIAKDIHDDLGASLTRITLLSQSGRADQDDPHQSAVHLDQIYHTARELTRAMDEIVWAVSPQHDTVDSLVTYLGKFAQDFLSVAGIRCRLNVPIELPAWQMTAEVRHNLFLAFKEALHNVLKHASATEVRVTLLPSESGFWLVVDDNGKGFNTGCNGNASAHAASDHGLRFSHGNGLANVKKRLEEIGGRFELKSAPGEGTTVRFWINERT